MYEYLQALHQRFFREPEHTELHEEITKLRQELEGDGLYFYDADTGYHARTWGIYEEKNLNNEIYH